MLTEDIADTMACEGVEYTVLHKYAVHDFEDNELRELVIKFREIHAEIDARVKSLIPEDHEFQTY